MRDAHLTADELQHLCEDGDSDVLRRIFFHHLAVCPECHAVAGFILDAYEAGDVTLDLCSIDIDLARTRKQAPALWEELQARPQQERLALVKEDERFVSWGLAEFLAQTSREEAARDPAEAVRIAELAVEVSMLLRDWTPAEDSWLCLLRGYVWVHLTNAHRAAGDLQAGARAFAAAEALWEPAFANTGDVLDYEAQYLSLKASFLRATRRFKEALKALDEAFSAKHTASMHLSLFIKKAKTYEEWGDMGEAIRVLAEARVLPVSEADARLRLCLTQNYLDYLSKDGRFLEAKCLLPEVSAVVDASGGVGDRLRLRWTEARIAQGLGRIAEAVRLLGEVQTDLAALKLPYDAALASLELALLQSLCGRSGEVKRLAAEALAYFDAQEIGREALGAVTLFRKAVEAEQVTSELVSQVLACLRRARRGDHL